MSVVPDLQFGEGADHQYMDFNFDSISCSMIFLHFVGSKLNSSNCIGQCCEQFTMRWLVSNKLDSSNDGQLGLDNDN